MPRALYKIGEPTSRQAIYPATVYLVADISMTVACLDERLSETTGVPLRQMRLNVGRYSLRRRAEHDTTARLG